MTDEMRNKLLQEMYDNIKEILRNVKLGNKFRHIKGKDNER